MNFEQELQAKVENVEQILRKYLPAEEGNQKTIFQAMNYSVLAGGKRLRPILMYEVYKMFGGCGEEIEPFMAAIEMIHSSSLVHDDLPAMDADEYRRGKETTWVAFGEDMAILAGDALMIYAFEVASKAFTLSADPLPAAEAIRILANKSGIYGMVGGQTVDVEMTGKDMTKEILDFIYRLKTGALLEASMLIGAVLGGADKAQQSLIEEIAANVGMAFQIQDDILDMVSTTEALGKPVHSDDKNNKTTYATLYGIEQARKDVAAISGKAISSLKQLNCRNDFLTALIEMLITREK